MFEIVDVRRCAPITRTAWVAPKNAGARMAVLVTPSTGGVGARTDISESRVRFAVVQVFGAETAIENASATIILAICTLGAASVDPDS